MWMRRRTDSQDDSGTLSSVEHEKPLPESCETSTKSCDDENQSQASKHNIKFCKDVSPTLSVGSTDCVEYSPRSVSNSPLESNRDGESGSGDMNPKVVGPLSLRSSHSSSSLDSSEKKVDDISESSDLESAEFSKDSIEKEPPASPNGFSCSKLDKHSEKRHGNKSNKVLQKIKVVARIRPLSSSELEAGCQSCLKATIVADGSLPCSHLICHSNTIDGNKIFEFDKVLDHHVSQQDAYESIFGTKTLTETIFEGYNATILAYGQTGSGKTFSVLGGNSPTTPISPKRSKKPSSLDDCSTVQGKMSPNTAKIPAKRARCQSTCSMLFEEPDFLLEEDHGIIPRAIHDLFCARDEYLQSPGKGLHGESYLPHVEITVSVMELYNEKLIDLLAYSTVSDLYSTLDMTFS